MSREGHADPRPLPPPPVTLGAADRNPGTFRRVNRNLVLVVIALSLWVGVSACGSDGSGRYNGSGGEAGQLDAPPEKLDGSESQEFEADDIARAEDASDAIKDYCSDAVSEAQEVGCLSHVDESDIP